MAEVQFQPNNGHGEQFQITQIAGYRVVGCFYPHVGIRRSFYVYVFERQDATTPFVKINVGSGEQPPKGTLSLAVTQRNLSFSGIELLKIETAVSHRERVRLTTFSYRNEGEGPISAQFKYLSAQEVKDTNRLGSNYQFSLGGGFRDNLLGFHSLLTPSEKVLLRLSSIPNKEHASWLKAIIQLNNDWDANRENPPSFDVVVGQRKVSLTPESLDALLIDESYGSMTAMPQPSLSQLYGTNHPENALGVSLNRDRPSEWVSHWHMRDFQGLNSGDQTELAPGASRSSVETATIILKPQNYNDLSII